MELLASWNKNQAEKTIFSKLEIKILQNKNKNLFQEDHCQKVKDVKDILLRINYNKIKIKPEEVPDHSKKVEKNQHINNFKTKC